MALPTTSAEFRRELETTIGAARERAKRRAAAVEIHRPELERLARPSSATGAAVLELLDAYDAAVNERDTYRELAHAAVTEIARIDRVAQVQP